VIKWKYIENAANAVMDRNNDGCRIVIGAGVPYKPLPDIEGKVKSCEGWS